MSEKTDAKKTMSVPELNAQLAKRAKAARTALLSADNEYSSIIDLYEEGILALDFDNIRLREVAKDYFSELGEIKKNHKEESVDEVLRDLIRDTSLMDVVCCLDMISQDYPGHYITMHKGGIVIYPGPGDVEETVSPKEIVDSLLLSGKIDVNIPKEHPKVAGPISKLASKESIQDLAQTTVKDDKKEQDGQSTEKSNA